MSSPYGRSGYGMGAGYGGSAYGGGGYGAGYGSAYGGSSMYGGGRRGGAYGGRMSMYGRGGSSMYGGGMYGSNVNMMGPAADSGWMSSVQRTLHGFGQFSELLDGSYFSMNDSFSSLMEFLHVVGQLRHHVLFIVKALAGLMVLQMTGKSVKEYLGWRSNESVDPDLASFQRYASTRKPASVWPKLLLVAGLAAVFGPYLWRKMFAARSAKKVPARKVVAVYDYVAQTSEELALRTGDVIEIEDDRSNPEWWKGRDEEGNAGFFPSAFCETFMLDNDLDVRQDEMEQDEEVDEETKLMRKRAMDIVRERRRRDREAPQPRTPMPNTRGAGMMGHPGSSPGGMYQNNGMYDDNDMALEQRRLTYSSPAVY
jgi:hypothetical protein